jgi:hypothetical protein
VDPSPSPEPPRARAQGRRRAARALGLALLGLALAGCRLIAADTYNLDQLHSADGGHRYSGALEGSIEYLLRTQLAPLFPRSRLARPKSPEPIEDPADECLERLLRLASYNPATPAVAGRQVEWFARLAVDDRAQLSRERSLIELGRAAERLRVGPEALPEGIEAAGAEVLGEALTSLARAVVGALSGPGSRASRALDLDAAVGVVEGLELDLEGARRALFVTTELVQKGGQYSDATAPLARLDEHLQRICIARALAAALQDKVPYVRAAALEAAWHGAGPDVLAPVLADLSSQPPEVAMRAMTLAARGGLPTGTPPPEDLHGDWLTAIVQQLGRLLRGESEVSVRAAQALTVLCPDGPGSLRVEEWKDWWDARRGRTRGGDAGPPQGAP